jgi:hypothetical protein
MKKSDYFPLWPVTKFGSSLVDDCYYVYITTLAFLLLANFRQIPTWKIWFRPKEGFSMKKNCPNSPDFETKLLSIARFLFLVPVSSQKYRKILIFSYIHISTCQQIWLNHFRDDNHLSYITKLKKETLPCIWHLFIINLEH